MASKILIIDDNEAIVDALTILFRKAGYLVSASEDGHEVYDEQFIFPDIILMDAYMAGSDGREICKFLKNQARSSAVPIIMISASRDIAITSKNAGADDFVTKPFDNKMLLNKVAQYING